MAYLSKIVLALCAVLTTVAFIQPYRPVVVRGESMLPTFIDGQLVFSVPLNRAPKVGDIVVVDVAGTTMIKRVSMVPGDKYLEVRPKHVKSWSIASTAAAKRLAHQGAVSSRNRTIPEGMMYITGDNPDHSMDSRSFGLVTTDSIIGVIQPIM